MQPTEAAATAPVVRLHAADADRCGHCAGLGQVLTEGYHYPDLPRCMRCGGWGYVARSEPATAAARRTLAKHAAAVLAVEQLAASVGCTAVLWLPATEGQRRGLPPGSAPVALWSRVDLLGQQSGLACRVMAWMPAGPVVYYRES